MSEETNDFKPLADADDATSQQPVAAAGGQNEPEAQPGIAAGKLPPDAGGRAGDPDSFG